MQLKISLPAFYIQQFDWLLLTAFEYFQTTSRNTRKLYNTLFPLLAFAMQILHTHISTCAICAIYGAANADAINGPWYGHGIWRHHLCTNRQDLNPLRVESPALCVKCPAVVGAPKYIWSDWTWSWLRFGKETFDQVKLDQKRKVHLFIRRERPGGIPVFEVGATSLHCHVGRFLHQWFFGTLNWLIFWT